MIPKSQRYWLFLWSNYYPNGGLNDLIGKFATIKKAVAFIDQDWVYWGDEDGYTRSEFKSPESRKEELFGEVVDMLTEKVILIKRAGYDFMTKRQYEKMSNPKKIRQKKVPAPKPITARRLKLRGYKWKIDHLTDEQLDWLQNGVPVEGKPNVRKPAPDYFYFFKEVDGAEVQIFKVGDEFYYSGVKLKHMNQIEICEGLAKEGKKWEAYEAKMKDTHPIRLENIGEPAAKVTGISEDDKGLNLKFELLPGHIFLKGGPVDGVIVKYRNSLPFYMTQIEVGEGEGAQVIAPRYKRSKDDPNIYEFDKCF